jgi:hypothetical protein
MPAAPGIICPNPRPLAEPGNHRPRSRSAGGRRVSIV